MGRNKSLISFFWVLLLAIQVMHAQERLEFSGPLQIGKFNGQARYSYFLKDSDTILDGSFTMQRSNLSALLENSDDFFSFQGYFNEGYPENQWNFQFGEFTSGSETEVVGYQYRIKVNGIQHQAQGDFSEGKPHGNWTYAVKEIENSEERKTLFSSTVEYDNGMPQRSFRIENEHNSLVGRFLRNGLAHDVWTLYSDEDSSLSESWYFNEGLLQKMEFGSEDGEISTINLPISYGPTQIIELDARFVELIKLKQSKIDSSAVINSGIPKLLTQNASYYKDLDVILSALGKSDFKQGFKVKVAYFPLDSIQRKNVELIVSSYANTSKLGNSLLNNTQLNILRRSDTDAQFLYGVVSKFSEDFLNPLERLVDFHDQGMLEFISREELFQNLYPTGLPSKTLVIDVEGQRKQYEGPYSADYNFDSNSLSTMQQLSKYVETSLQSISGILNEKLVKDSKQQEFIALEEEMISHANHIKQTIDSVRTGLSRKQKLALQRIQDLADEELKKYASMEGTEAKKDFGNRVITCLGHLDGLADAISLLPVRWDTIQATYKDDVWNPFMATIMSEEVKKRITLAYRNVLEPFLLDEAVTNLTCDNAGQIKELFNASYQRMLEMRDENTTKLERKLRKEQDPKMVLQLFNLKSSEND